MLVPLICMAARATCNFFILISLVFLGYLAVSISASLWSSLPSLVFLPADSTCYYVKLRPMKGNHVLDLGCGTGYLLIF